VLVLSSRETPPLALPRLRVQGELAEFRETDLQFDTGEVEALLQATPGAAVRVAPQQLLARTQGWAVGLRLALNTLADGRASAGALRSAALDRHVFDYLAAEVLEDMPAELRRFLLRCSVLPELSAARCLQVSQDARAAQWLEEIEQRGLFVSSLDGAELTLRLHDLFRDFLEDRLGRELPLELPELLKRAAAGEEDTVRRIGYLLRAGATDEASAQLCAEGPTLITRGVIAPVLRMIEQFPSALRNGPRLQLLRGQGAWAMWDFDTMRETMHAAAVGHARRGERDGELLALAYEALALCGAYRMPQAEALLSRLLEQDLPDAALVCVLHARVWQALDWGPPEELARRFTREIDLVERLDSALLWYHASPVARYLGAPGIIAPLQRFVRGAMRHCQAGATPLRVLTLTLQALLLMWAGSPDDAEAVLVTAEDDARWLGGMRGLGVQTQACRVLLHALRGEADAARAAMQRPRELLEKEPDGPRRRMVLAAQQMQEARLSAWLGDVPRLRELSAQLECLPAQHIDAATDAQRALLPAYLADADGQPARAIALRRAALQHEARLGRLGLGVETRLRLAASLLTGEGAAAAADSLQPALLAIDDATELAAVLLAGPAVLRTLAETDWGGHLDAPARGRLQLWAAHSQRIRRGVEPGTGATPPSAPAGLSAREAEVLERIAVGDSNKLIARALALSPHTVKRHVANILDKVGVQTRGQAAAWYRARR
jgi:LuxR family maltose regulon positive regulatory protein